MSNFTRILFVLAVLLMSMGAQARPAQADSGNCGTFTTVVSVKCMYGSWTGQRYGGGVALWNSAALNIAESSAHSGQFIAQAMWFAGFSPSGTQTFLKVGITGGTSTMIGNSNKWERWYYWVDGTVPGSIFIHGLVQAPNDNVQRQYQMNADRNGTGLWGVLAGCDPTCWGAQIQWADPSTSTFNNTLYMAGLEVTPGVMNSSSNAPTFQDRALGAWNWSTVVWELPAWSSQVDRPCTSNPVPFCLNGNTPGSGNTWDNNKPN